MKQKALRVLAIGAIIVVFFGILECGSFFILHRVMAVPLSSEKFYVLKNNGAFERYVSNPLFGYQINPEISDNNYGLPASMDLPYVKGGNEYVIGILGGSVAEQFARYLEHSTPILNEFKGALKLNGKKLTVLNLALASMKQPQQFIIASQFYEGADLIINIDGHNENLHDLQEDLPIEYPAMTNGLYFMTYEKNKLVSKAHFILKCKALMTYLPLHVPLIGRSFFYFIFWRQGIEFLNHRLFSINNKLLFKAKPSLAHSFKQSLEERREKRLLLWEKYTSLQQAVLKSRGVQSYYFLEPKAIVGSKPLTPQEQAGLRASEVDISEWLEVYKNLRQSVVRMRAKGIKAFDLSMVYEHETESIYIDGCCHVSDRGNEIMAKEIISKISVH